MELINKMIRGKEETLQAAITFSIVIWPNHLSTQNIEGYGGDRSRNINAIANAMKKAISGSAKGPCISSHPHHINIIDKQDGTPNFQCMRINFDTRADRNLFCQARLVIPQLRAYQIAIEVGQEDGGTTMNPTRMFANWSKEERVRKKETKPTHTITTTTITVPNDQTSHTTNTNIAKSLEKTPRSGTQHKNTKAQPTPL